MRNTNKLLLLMLCGTLCLPRVAQAQKENEKNKDLKPSQKEGKRDRTLKPSQKEGKRDRTLKPSQKENEKNKDIKPSQKEDKKERVFKPFKLGFCIPFFGGYSFVSTSAVSDEEEVSGISIFYLEPQYAITDKIGVGFRYEAYLSGSLYGLTGDYYLTTSIVRPSAGLILGLYDQRITFYNENENENVHSSSRIKAVGISPRLKLNIGRTVLAYTYHLTLRKEAYNYSSLNLGFYLWG